MTMTLAGQRRRAARRIAARSRTIGGRGWRGWLPAWLALAVALGAPRPAHAAPADSSGTAFQEPVAAAGAARRAWTLGFTLDRGHDDNVIQLTRQSLDRFGRTPGPPSFRIGQVGDMQTGGTAVARWHGRLAPRRDTRLSLAGELHRFDHDRIVDWQQYELAAEQELTATHRNLAALGLHLSYLPRYYLGEIIDVDESQAAQTSNRGAIRHSLTFAQTTSGALFEQDLLRGRLAVAGELERVHRAYNSHFLERTNDNDQWSLWAAATPFRRWPATARVTWLRGRLHARGDLPDTLGITDVDISYDHDGIGAALTLPWNLGSRGARRRGGSGRFDASFMPEIRHYTTSDKFDILRFGRENHRRDVRLRATQRLWGPIDAIVTWERLTSRAEFHQGITFPPEQTNFDQEQFGVQLRARWEIVL